MPFTSSTWFRWKLWLVAAPQEWPHPDLPDHSASQRFLVRTQIRNPTGRIAMNPCPVARSHRVLSFLMMRMVRVNCWQISVLMC